MKNVLNQLIQLQELDFALAEEKASASKMPLAQLEAAYQRTLQDLPEEYAQRYGRLRQRFPLAVVPLMHGMCPSCNRAVPAALVNAVKAAEQIQACPHCGRFLYLPEAVARQPRQHLAGQRPVQAGLARFSSPDLMIQLTGETREEVIGELAQRLAEKGFIEDAVVVTEMALKREAIVSTAVEHGLAFPHVRDAVGGGLMLGLGLKPKGFAMDAPDGNLTKIVFFLVIPTAASAFYLRLLAGLVETFSDSEARKTLLECETPEQIWKTLIKLTRKAVP